MGVLSSLRQKSFNISRSLCKSYGQQISVRAMSEHRVMHFTASRWQFHKFKDMMHFYTLLGVIPLSIATVYAYVFVGPAKLAPIPAGYLPEPQEYHRNPVTRFIVKYWYHHYQEEYEKTMHILYKENEMKEMRLLEKRIKELLNEKHDVKAYTYQPIMTKYFKHVREVHDKMYDHSGNN